MADPTRTVTAPDGPPTASLADPAATTGGDPDAVSTISPTPPARYQLGEPIARGGMGEVFRAADTVLGREVAVKVLQDRYAPGSATARRFADEARITGQLQHPGIPPVHDLGTLPDGRPFLAMKLIKGETLADLLTGGRVNTLAVFEGVCQAVGYAHAHGVIHRDLKPANVMVGSFGEVQVMDWGLAKILASGGRQPPEAEADPDATASLDPTEIKSLREAETQAGSLLGTPAYMAPEQAIGAIDQIDLRTDVFGLGGILCSLLTGKPPFVGDTAESTRQLAARAKLDDAFARLDGCGAEPDLIALCRRCLSAEKADRPADAGEVAAAVAALRAAADDRARRAEIDRERAVVESREQRKRRRVVQWAGGITAAVLLAGVIGTTVSLFEAQKQEGIARGEAAAKEVALGERTAALGKAQERANTLFAGLDALTANIVGDSLAAQIQVSEEQKLFLTTVLPLYKRLAQETGNDEETRARVARGAFRVGLIENRIGRKADSIKAFQQAREAFAALAAEFPAVHDYQYGLATSHNNMGVVLIALGQSEAAEEQCRTGVGLLEKLADDFPANPKYRVTLATSHNNLGNAFHAQGNGKAAEEQYRRGLAIREKLVADFPADPAYRSDLAASHTNLGVVLRALGQSEAAEEQYRTGVGLLEKLAVEFPAVSDYRRNLATSHTNLGNLLSQSGKWAEAEEQYRRGLAIREKLAADFPADPAYRVSLGSSYGNLGLMIRDSGRPAESMVWFDKAIHTLAQVVQANPRNMGARSFLRNCHWGRAVAYDRLKSHVKAVQDWDRAVELSPPPEQPEYRASRALSKAYVGMLAEAVDEMAELRKLPGVTPLSMYNCACVYAVASAKLADKKAEYIAAAMEMLTKAVKAGYKNHAHMRKDTDLDPIRDREDFRKLLADLEAKFPPTREVLPAPRREFP